jgi:peptidoglycan/LPS O-acetylase OafA/YrhL
VPLWPWKGPPFLVVLCSMSFATDGFRSNVQVMRPERHLYPLVIVVAVAVWLLAWLLLGRKEAWDHPSYFSVSIPVMSLVAGYAGYGAKIRAWRWPLTLIIAQVAAALLLNGFGNLFPLGVIVFVVLAAPMMLAASVGAWLGRRKEQRAS